MNHLGELGVSFRPKRVGFADVGRCRILRVEVGMGRFGFVWACVGSCGLVWEDRAEEEEEEDQYRGCDAFGVVVAFTIVIVIVIVNLKGRGNPSNLKHAPTAGHTTR